MKKLLYLQYIVIGITVALFAVGYIKSICFLIGAANPFFLLLVVFWGPVIAVSFIYMLTVIFKRFNKLIKKQLRVSVYSVVH